MNEWPLFSTLDQILERHGITRGFYGIEDWILDYSDLQARRFIRAHTPKGVTL